MTWQTKTRTKNCDAWIRMKMFTASKDVGADMVCGRPSSCYGLRDAWKFQATPTLQSTQQQRTLDRPAVSKHDTRLLWTFLTSCDLDLWPFHLKIGLPLTRALGTSVPILSFLYFYVFEFRVKSWWRSIVVRSPVLAGELSLSCARLMAGRVTTLWVKRPLSANQHGQLSQPSLRGRLNE